MSSDSTGSSHTTINTAMCSASKFSNPADDTCWLSTSATRNGVLMGLNAAGEDRATTPRSRRCSITCPDASANMDARSLSGRSRMTVLYTSLNDTCRHTTDATQCTAILATNGDRERSRRAAMSSHSCGAGVSSASSVSRSLQKRTTSRAGTSHHAVSDTSSSSRPTRGRTRAGVCSAMSASMVRQLARSAGDWEPRPTTA
mmetsp:Transcript_58862/g.138645  ORF Transcript_58862/g.138645 Transcript_58862/m.138645 type:complete len:201 (-) Transcript_58862:1126-1728(-)